mmetsp:Transcript_14337/g.22524  ORF Transcript_14337/g.22524 Transcript_14337/m.22524 type:complete len:115 (-) Transcript_14337:104-448(-)
MNAKVASVGLVSLGGFAVFMCNQLEKIQAENFAMMSKKEIRKELQVNDFKDEVGKMLEELPQKTTQQKLEAVVDGAVRTHNIGFPQSQKRIVASAPVGVAASLLDKKRIAFYIA